MKFLSFLSIGLLFIACSKDDDTPDPVNEEEVITTLRVTLTSDGVSNVTLQSRDLDGDGPDEPVITVSGNLVANTNYTGSITLLNETANPAEDITSEVEEEAEDHQFFYTTAGALDITVTATNNDANGNPLGTEFSLVTRGSSSGILTFTLRHEPQKPNTGLSDAGGETDFTATFPISIE